jgi:hypothetical protein
MYMCSSSPLPARSLETTISTGWSPREGI